MFLALRTSWDFVRELHFKNVADELKNIQQWWNDHDSGLRQFGALSTAGQLRTGTRSITASSNLSFADHIVFANSTSGVVTISLPTAKGIKGQQYIIKRINSGANFVTIVPDGSETIDGGVSYSLAAQYHSIAVVSDGSNWMILF